MNNDNAIYVENIGKKYFISNEKKFKELKQLLNHLGKSIFLKLRNFSNENKLNNIKTIWALRNVSFNVKTGECICLIGRNGAGKSTLLKILSRITTPSEGIAEVCGRVGTLLEVGTGFYHELTGRENIYFNGALLGMTRNDIFNKLDDIISFSEVEKYIDTPVKYYSTGMVMRLAFSVAAHLDSEIIFVDEAISVGDISFQKKCLNKLWEISQTGRTVIFVSHNIKALQKLCKRGILLHNGNLLIDGPLDDVLNKYLQFCLNIPSYKKWDNQNCPEDDVIRLLSVRVCNSKGESINSISILDSIGIEIEYEVKKSNQLPVVIFQFYNSEWVLLFESNDLLIKKEKNNNSYKGYINEICYVPENIFTEGKIIVSVLICSVYPYYKEHVFQKDVVSFEIFESKDLFLIEEQNTIKYHGVVRPLLKWEIKK